jgi:hypothetical protein
MKTKSKGEGADELRAEYNLGELLKHGIQGKYVERCREGTNIVLLAPDVAQAFPDDEAVNKALRLVMRLQRLSFRKKKSAAKS